MTDVPPGNYPPPPPGGSYPPPPPGGFPPPGGGPVPGGAPPDNNLVWGILVTVLCGCGLPLGIVSIVKATQVSGLWASGQYAAAQKSADDAKKFAIWGAIAGIVFAVLYVIVVFAIGGFASMSSYN
jgi:hypothetical protein